MDPNPDVGDSRIRFRPQEREDWAWYMVITSQSNQQSVGRGGDGPTTSVDTTCWMVHSGTFVCTPQGQAFPGDAYQAAAV